MFLLPRNPLLVRVELLTFFCPKSYRKATRHGPIGHAQWFENAYILGGKSRFDIDV